MVNKEQIQQAEKSFKRSTLPLLSPALLVNVETVCDAVSNYLFNKHKGFKTSEKMIWSCVTNTKEKLVPFLNAELQKDWQIMENFLLECFGKNVIENLLKLEKSHQIINEFRQKHKLYSFWNLGLTDEDILNKPYPSPKSKLSYTESSGWGQPSCVNLPQNPTYGDLWIAADSLFRHSGDPQNNSIISFNVEKEHLTEERLVVYFDIHQDNTVQQALSAS